MSAAEYADEGRAVAIADAARRLAELRDRWLHPPEWVDWIDEPVPGYLQRPVAHDEAAATQIKVRSGSPMRTRRLMLPSRQPTGGTRGFLRTKRCGICWC